MVFEATRRMNDDFRHRHPVNSFLTVALGLTAIVVFFGTAFFAIVLDRQFAPSMQWLTPRVQMANLSALTLFIATILLVRRMRKNYAQRENVPLEFIEKTMSGAMPRRRRPGKLIIVLGSLLLGFGAVFLFFPRMEAYVAHGLAEKTPFDRIVDISYTQGSRSKRVGIFDEALNLGEFNLWNRMPQLRDVGRVRLVGELSDHGLMVEKIVLLED